MHVEKQVWVNGKEINKIEITEHEKEVFKCLDETIMEVAEKVKKETMAVDGYADTVKALATLVEARAHLL